MTLTVRVLFLRNALAKCFGLLIGLCSLFIAVSYASPAPNIQLATEYALDDHTQIGAFLVSEKLDGVRGYWDGQRLFTRQGNPILVPSWFTAEFPTIAMEGELWLGRGQFEAISGLIRQTSPKDTDWQKVRFMVFDLPTTKGSFEDRYLQMQTLIVGKSAYLQVIEQFSVDSVEALYDTLNTLVALGAEGLILHRRTAVYTPGRNPNVMKLKPYLDAEATVIGYVAGKGQFAGKMGALRVQTPEGRIFSIGTGFNLAERQYPPAIGTLITYKYLGLTVNGLPRFASYLRIRTDIVPEDKEVKE
ncbi:DNA ligase [Shewanella xiamenensis]|uniref:DNA ligase n=1 Tax=Shewanella xiamenensis TaxID=332186 RepID=UPI00217952EA|nr:DNA ligase [Shewanella xiamenensis]BDQ65988.1 ATP-dependent DNA ligase [Shewanella xiamenensis]GLD76573.1 ATP-dependent DNA ligase [Shewanella xiamenensis]